MMKTVFVYPAIAFALAASIVATVLAEPEAAFACTTGDRSAGWC